MLGSSDGGMTVRDSNRLARQKATEIAQALGLKPHCVGSADTILSLAADIEIHHAHDGRLYIIDCARLLPPNPPPSRELAANIFSQFFRPEFVVHYSEQHNVRLSADAFSRFNRSVSRKVDDKEVRVMFRFYKDTHLPLVGAALDADPDVCVNISAALHSHGVNLRHLGLIFAHVSDPAVQSAIGEEIIVRTIKSVLRSDLWCATNDAGRLEPQKLHVLLMGRWTLLTGPEWASHLTEAVRAKFQFDLRY